MPNGAQALIRTLVDGGVTTCFSNPGTSEMHFVAALDSVPEMRGVLGLFEGVVTGAADGYGRTSSTNCTPTSSRRSEEHTSELQSRQYLVCRLLLEKKQDLLPHKT